MPWVQRDDAKQSACVRASLLICHVSRGVRFVPTADVPTLTTIRRGQLAACGCQRCSEIACLHLGGVVA